MLQASLEAGEVTLYREGSWMPTRSVWYRFTPTTSGTATFAVSDSGRHRVNVFADKNGTLAGAVVVSTYGRASVSSGTAYAVQVVVTAFPWRSADWFPYSPTLAPTVTTTWATGGACCSLCHLPVRA